MTEMYVAKCPVCGEEPITEHVYPPIPTIEYDYHTYCLNCQDDGPANHEGWGPTGPESAEEWNSCVKEE